MLAPRHVAARAVVPLKFTVFVENGFAGYRDPHRRAIASFRLVREPRNGLTTLHVPEILGIRLRRRLEGGHIRAALSNQIRARLLEMPFHRFRKLHEPAVRILPPEPVVGELAQVVDQLAALRQFVLDQFLVRDIAAETDHTAVGRLAVGHQQPTALMTAHDFSHFGATAAAPNVVQILFERAAVDDFGRRHLVVLGGNVVQARARHEQMRSFRVQSAKRPVAIHQPVFAVVQRNADVRRFERAFPRKRTRLHLADPDATADPIESQRHEECGAKRADKKRHGVRRQRGDRRQRCRGQRSNECNG